MISKPQIKVTTELIHTYNTLFNAIPMKCFVSHRPLFHERQVRRSVEQKKMSECSMICACLKLLGTRLGQQANAIFQP